LRAITAPIFDIQFLDFRSDQQVDFDVGKISQIRSCGIVTHVSLDVELIPPNSGGELTPTSCVMGKPKLSAAAMKALQAGCGLQHLRTKGEGLCCSAIVAKPTGSARVEGGTDAIAVLGRDIDNVCLRAEVERFVMEVLRRLEVVPQLSDRNER
jgi:hypothetical protein